MVRTLFLLALLITPAFASAIEPGEPIDYKPLAFYPDRWEKQGVDFTMIPWRGESVVFLTTTPDFDHGVMSGLIGTLDRGWSHYAELTDNSPRPTRVVEGMPVLAAVPGSGLTCGYGCGYVGGTGIELSAFYRSDYKRIAADPKAIPDYYFYEMGRNYYTFGDKHSLFVTGFAVFMRYVCLDELGLKSGQPTRQIIETAESIFAESDLPFLQAFTNHAGLSEKQNRLKDTDGKVISPTDQPVMYASAMLRLRRDYGGDAWVGRFFRQLARCPAVKPTDEATALRQAMNWFAAASCAAGQDLSPVFVDAWRMPLTEAQRELLAGISWDSESLNAGEIVERLTAAE